MNDILKIVKPLEAAGLLRKGVSETIENEPKCQKGGFLGQLLGTLGVSLLGKLLTGKGVETKIPSVERSKKDWLRNNQRRRRHDQSWSEMLMPPNPLSDFEIENYDQNKPKLNGVY